MLVVPTQPVPTQTLQVTLAGQNCEIGIYVTNQGLFFDLTSNGIPVSVANLSRNIILLNPISYTGFIGNFIFIDTQGSDDPEWSGLGSRFFLIYLDAAEVEAYELPGPGEGPLNLLTTDDLIIIYTDEGDVIEVILT